MTTPLATYRLQFRGDTTFARAAALVPYLARLGVDTLYASPLAQAVPGTTHGYDGVDYNRLDRDLGSDDDFRDLVNALRREGMGLLLDIVPNHLAASPFSPWWRDVLEWGAASRYASHFAIDWGADRLLVPVLGRAYGDVLDAGELALAFDPRDGGIAFAYYDIRLPLTPPSYAQVLARDPDQRFADLARRFALATPEDAERLKEELAAGEVAAAIPGILEGLGADHSALHALHEAQAWRLAHWRLARETLTYRRFFEIADLVGVRVESAQVFDDAHALVARLAEDGAVTGLRIDHVDGLADPRGYLRRLHEQIAGPHGLYVVVEKILAADEELRSSWPTAGTTGYEFIARLADLFVDSTGEAPMDAAYAAHLGERRDYAQLVQTTKRFIMARNLAGELEILRERARALAGRDPHTRDLGPDTLRRALIELMAAMPVYRTYVDVEGPGEEDRWILARAAELAKESREVEDEGAIDFLVRLLLLDLPSPEEQAEALAFTARFQQSSAPVMAKAVEDTVFYRYSRLLALNEVGGDPGRFGAGPEVFHAAMARRLSHQPDGLTTTSTHDTKRGEDARARLYALSEIPHVWAAAVARWSARHEGLRRRIDGGEAPEAETTWMFYQALAGAWPAELDRADRDGVAALSDRLSAYLVKALREAKLRTSWTAPDETYEAAVTGFVAEALQGQGAGAFLEDFLETCRPLFVAGALTGLGQALVKLAAPGVPDIYQGAELWDLSLVDPDNRRPVDFAARAALLDELDSMDAGATVARWREGLPKLLVLARGLAQRRRLPDLFRRGDHVPLEALGSQSSRVLAFARRTEESAAVVVAPRLCFDLLRDQDRPLVPPERWDDTSIDLPDHLAGPWTDALTGRTLGPTPLLRLQALLRDFPVALLIRSDTD